MFKNKETMRDFEQLNGLNINSVAPEEVMDKLHALDEAWSSYKETNSCEKVALCRTQLSSELLRVQAERQQSARKKEFSDMRARVMARRNNH